jgi:hypothetical protein
MLVDCRDLCGERLRIDNVNCRCSLNKSMDASGFIVRQRVFWIVEPLTPITPTAKSPDRGAENMTLIHNVNENGMLRNCPNS